MRCALEMLLRDMTNRKIATELDVITRTVEAHRHNIFRKTETESVPDLVEFTLAFQQSQPRLPTLNFAPT